MRYTILLMVLLSGVSQAQLIPTFDVQGHRGSRGLQPENTIPAFLAALDLGVTTVEMDLAITKDGQIIVSHEPWMSSEFCRKPDGTDITKEEELSFNIYQMAYEEVRQWDCGSKPHPRFPQQQKQKISKPLLSDVIIAIENHIKSYTKYEVDYNIEIKSEPDGDGVFHPAPAEFSDRVYQLLDQYLPMERVVIQSFDFRVLKYWHEKYPDIRLAALVENKKSPEENLKDLGFIPSIYSPDFNLLTKSNVKWLHTQKVDLTETHKKEKGKVRLRVIPWTVNESKDMLVLKGMGVDGIITDYPDRAATYKLTLKIATDKK
ncbi:MAG: glycerophosphodiester phosphodiesterase [Bacteroidetes bacterium]|nr:glycerophosphodiester phosphodiesterase [Bacteroidota bacterium]